MTSRHMDCGLLPENVTSLLKPELRFSHCHHQPLSALSSLPHLFSNKDVGGFLLRYPMPCWGFIFTSSPGQLYAKQLIARPDSPCQLTLYPAGCLTMQSAPHLCPDQLHPQSGRRHAMHLKTLDASTGKEIHAVVNKNLSMQHVLGLGVSYSQIHSIGQIFTRQMFL